MDSPEELNSTLSASRAALRCNRIQLDAEEAGPTSPVFFVCARAANPLVPEPLDSIREAAGMGEPGSEALGARRQEETSPVMDGTEYQPQTRTLARTWVARANLPALARNLRLKESVHLFLGGLQTLG